MSLNLVSNISEETLKSVNLSLGNNMIDSDLTVNFRSLPGHNTFQITPVNFKPGMSLDYVMYLFFKHRKFYKIGLALSTETDVMTCGEKHFDGEVNDIVTPIGTRNRVKVLAEKVVRLKGLRDCRQRPYIEEFNENFLQNLKRYCQRLCKNINYYMDCELIRPVVKNLTVCSTLKDQNCFREMISRTMANMTEQPCTQLAYPVQNSRIERKTGSMRVFFAMKFGESKVKVYVEYVVYDFVATIGAIGGTLGLCIGFSFTGVASFLLDYASTLKKKIRSEWKGFDVKAGQKPRITTKHTTKSHSTMIKNGSACQEDPGNGESNKEG